MGRKGREEREEEERVGEVVEDRGWEEGKGRKEAVRKESGREVEERGR
jgi:hypothetical protein